jgi:hypothetical protein
MAAFFQPPQTGGLEQIHCNGFVFDTVHVADIDLEHHVRKHVAPIEHDCVLEHNSNVGLGAVNELVADRDRSRAVGTKPATILRMVVLPQPLGPTIATNSDCLMSMVTFAHASMAPLLV